jgi:hypothetical protein
LAPEIRHERNVILPCVKFVVQHYNLRQSLAAKTVRKENSSVGESSTSAAAEVRSDTIDTNVSVDSAATEQTLKLVIVDVLGASKTSAETGARDADLSESPVTVSASDSTITPANAVADAIGHVDVTDGDSGIGSPLKNVLSSLPDDESKILYE